MYKTGDRAAIVREVRDFITAEYFLGRDADLADRASFLDEGILDSTGVLQLITFLEETYGIRVEDEEAIPDNLDSITNVASYLSRKLNAAPTPTDGDLIAGNPGGSL